MLQINYIESNLSIHGIYYPETKTICINKNLDDIDKQIAYYHELTHAVGFQYNLIPSFTTIGRKIEECIADYVASKLTNTKYPNRFNYVGEYYAQYIKEQAEIRINKIKDYKTKINEVN